MSKASNAKRAEAIAELRNVGVRPGAKVYTNLRHCSRSGMMRHISVHVVHKGSLTDVTWFVANALDYRLTNHGERALKVGGCGMDMGFHVVYCLGRVMFPKGGALKHSPRAHQEREVGRETDGGYLLKQVWL